MASEKDQSKGTAEMPTEQIVADGQTVVGLKSDTMTGAPVAVPIPVSPSDVKSPKGYKIEAIIGRGGMSVVYRAWHIMLNKPVAIKLLHSHLNTDEHALRRFRQEAQSAAKLEHPGIVTIHDFGVIDGKNTAFLCMDFLDGPGLCAIIKESPLPPKRALMLCRKICEAMQHAHDQGVVHRDLKPSNVLVLNAGTPQELPTIVDFGIAKMIHADGESQQDMTKTGESVGSPPYMSPEQCQGLQLDSRTDIYALGCLLYELITGSPPLRGATAYETIHKQITDLPDSVSKSRANLVNAEALDALILKAMAKNPAHRFTSMSEFAQAIDRALPQVDESADPFTRLKLRTQVAISRIRNRPQAALLTLTAAIVLIAGTAHFFSPKSPSAESARTTAITHKAEPEPARTLYREGLDLLDAHRFSEAEHKLKEAITAALEENGVTGPVYRDSLLKLIDVEKASGKSAEAAALEKELINLQQASLLPADPETNMKRLAELSAARLSNPNDAKLNTEYGTLLNKQAWVLTNNRDTKEALKMAEDALAFNNKLLGPNSANATESAILLAHIQGADMQLDAAEKKLTQLLAAAERQFGKNSWQTIQCELCLAANYARRLALARFNGDEQAAIKSADEAVKYYSIAEASCNSTFTAPTPWLAMSYNGKASVYNLSWCAGIGSREKLQEALNLAERAYQLQIQLLGKKSFIAAGTLAELGDIETNIALTETDRKTRTEMLEKADAKLLDAQMILEKTQLGESLKLAQVLNQRAFARESMGDWREAESLFRAAFTKARRWKSDSDLAKNAYAGLMRIYKVQGRTADEQALMQEVQAHTAQ